MSTRLFKAGIFTMVLLIGVISPLTMAFSSSVNAARPVQPPGKKPKPVPPPINTNVKWGLVETPGLGWDQEGHQDALSIGVTTMRVELRQIDDVSQFDAKFLQAAQDGIQLMPLLNQAAAIHNQYPEPDVFAQFVSAMAERYGSGGTFWVAHPELNQTLAPEVFELINEPDIFIQRDITLGGPQKYAQIVKASVAAGRAANPNAKYLIYAGGSVDDNGTQWVNYMFSAVPDIGNYVDYINAHPYLGLDRIVNARNAFIAKGVTRDVWISELGFSTSQQWSEQQQATWLTDWGNLVGQTTWIRSFFYFQYRDWQPGQYGYGLWHYDRTPKPAASAYAAIIAR